MTPSAARVARNWDSGLMNTQVATFKRELARFDLALATRDRLIEYRWHDVIRAGRPLTEWLLETRSVPKGKEKAAEMAFRLFMSASRAPKDMPAWNEKNRRHIDMLLTAIDWPAKGAAAEGSEETFPLAGFTIHNTVNLAGSSLESTKTVIERAVKVVRSMTAVPRVASIIYGNLFIVGRLKQPRTLAWYNIMTDEVYLRPHVKVGSEEAHNLVHELGHRYWFKVMTREAKAMWAGHHMSTGFSRPAVPMPKAGDPYPFPIRGRKERPIIEKVEGGQIYFVGGGTIGAYQTMQYLQREAAFPSPYSETSPEEHFAEAFAMYGLGDLKPEHIEAFDSIVIRGEKYRPVKFVEEKMAAERVAERFIRG